MRSYAERGSVARMAAALVVLLCAACSPTRGCAEDDFDLAEQSRLPRWFVVPDGLDRADVAVKMTYFLGMAGKTATFELVDRDGRTLAEVDGRVRDLEPQRLSAEPGGGLSYPVYEVVTAESITEVVEHRERGPYFHITDDPDVYRELGVDHR